MGDKYLVSNHHYAPINKNDLHIVESLQVFASILEFLVFILRNSRDLFDYYAFGLQLHIKVHMLSIYSKHIINVPA